MASRDPKQVRIIARIPARLKDDFERTAYLQHVSAGEALRRAMLAYIAAAQAAQAPVPHD